MQKVARRPSQAPRRQLARDVIAFLDDLRSALEDTAGPELEWGLLVLETWTEYLRAEERRLNEPPLPGPYDDPANVEVTAAVVPLRDIIFETWRESWRLSFRLMGLPLFLAFTITARALYPCREYSESHPAGDEAVTEAKTSSSRRARASTARTLVGSASSRLSKEE